MIDFFFFLKTLALTLIVVLLLQIQIGKKTVETHIHDSMQGSFAAGFIGDAALGGAHILRDLTHNITQKIKANITHKHQAEDSETKASRFQWLWQKAPAKDKDEAPVSTS